MRLFIVFFLLINLSFNNIIFPLYIIKEDIPLCPNMPMDKEIEDENEEKNDKESKIEIDEDYICYKHNILNLLDISTFYLSSKSNFSNKKVDFQRLCLVIVYPTRSLISFLNSFLNKKLYLKGLV